MAVRRPFPRFAGLLRSLVLLPLLLVLTGCAMVDPLTREICLSVLPALQADDARITVLAIDPDPAREENVRISYRVEDPRGPRRTFLVCAFGPDTATGDARALIGLRDHHGVMSDARFYMLRRFWLADPAVVAEAASRVHIEPRALPHGLATLPTGAARILQGVVDATAPAALYALLSLACALIWGLVGRIVFVFGDVAMLGAYGALIGALTAQGFGAAATGPIVVLGVLVAMAVGASWGATLGRTVFGPLAFRAAQPLLIATVGLSLALQEFVARAQGARERFLEPMFNHPLLVADGPFTVSVTPMRLVVVASTVAAVAAVVVVFPRSRIGRAWRAVSDDAFMARLLGIDPAHVLVVTFALAAVLAALAGAILTLAYGGTSFHMGTMLGLKAVVAAVVGGIGSLPGAALGGLLVGAMETAWSTVFGIEWRDTAVLTLLVVFLIFRPAGLLGQPEPPGPRDRRV
jgi:branched-chain amino acid transport system permease protein